MRPLDLLRALRALFAPPQPQPPMIPLGRAMLCAETTCEMLWDCRDRGECPVCGSEGIPVGVIARVEPPAVEGRRKAMIERAAKTFRAHLNAQREEDTCR